MTEDTNLGLSRRTLLGAAGAIGGVGTMAFFSEEEEFANDRLTAGALDLKVDWQEQYSDWSADEAAAVSDVTMVEDADPATVPPGYLGLPDPRNPLLAVPNDEVDAFMDAIAVEAYPDRDDDARRDPKPADLAWCDWLADADTPDALASDRRTEATVGTDPNPQTTEPGDPLLEMADVKPGDFGVLTLGFHLCDNPGYVWLRGALREALEDGLTDPERADPDEEAGVVELLDAVRTTLWYDAPDGNGVIEPVGVGGEGEEVFFRGSLREALQALSSGNGIPLDGDQVTASPEVGTPFDELGDPPDHPNRDCFEASLTGHVGFAWYLPVDHADEIQSDAISFDLGLYTEQCRHNTGAGIDEFPTAVAAQFIDRYQGDLSGAVTHFTGPVPPGTTLSGLAGGSLTVPSREGNYYAFVVDEQPNHLFGHEVQYAWLDADGGTVEDAPAEWWPVLDAPTPFDVEFPEPARVVQGHPFLFGDPVESGGEQTANDQQTGGDEEPKVSCPDDPTLPEFLKERFDREDVEIKNGSAVEASTDRQNDADEDDDGVVCCYDYVVDTGDAKLSGTFYIDDPEDDGDDGGDIPPPSGTDSLPPDSGDRSDWKGTNSYALVIDGGFFRDGLRIDQFVGAADLAGWAGDIADWLAECDFQVQRISQHVPDGENPPTPPAIGGQVDDPTFFSSKTQGVGEDDTPSDAYGSLKALIERYAQAFNTACGADFPEPDINFHLTVVAHGHEDGWLLISNPSEGLETFDNKRKFTSLPYQSRTVKTEMTPGVAYDEGLKEMLQKFPDCVHITVIIVACYSGQAVGPLDGPADVIVTTSPTDQPTHRSIVNAFTEDAGKLDDDEKQNDLGDKFRNMKTVSENSKEDEKYPPRKDTDGGDFGPLDYCNDTR